MAALFAVGAVRALVTADRWWRTGLEMLALGALVAASAYGAGAVVSALIGLR
jgi:VIT1/CCC1 family predicted Fe2+/Mn2+ transporter